MITLVPWERNAALLSLEAIDKILFSKEASVDKWLHNGIYSCNYITGSKGVGKSLLIAAKRSQIESIDHASECLLLPIRKGSKDPGIDRGLDYNALEKNNLNYFSDIVSAQNAWKIAIALSILTNIENQEYKDRVINNLKYRGYGEIASFVSNVLKAPMSPSEILSSIFVPVALNEGKNIFLDNPAIGNIGNILLTSVVNTIKRYICLFIDGTDEVSQNIDAHIWANIQNGLLMASEMIMQRNEKIKIFASIRQEAWVQFDEPDKGKMKSRICFIDYSDTLKDMADYLSQRYEKKSFYDLLETTRIYSVRGYDEIDSFEFVQMHTINRPRDIVDICAQISQRKATGQDSIRNIVHKVSSEITHQVFSEYSIFNKSINKDDFDYKEKWRFLKNSITRNVLEEKNTFEICKNFNEIFNPKIDAHDCNPKKCKDCIDGKHVFCDLYSIGLIGVVQEQAYDGVERIHFLDTFSMEFSKGKLTYKNTFLFVHPCFSSWLGHDNNQYHTLACVRVKQGTVWGEFERKCCALQLMLFDSVRFSNPTVKSLSKRVKTVFFNKEKLRNTDVLSDLLKIAKNSDPRSNNDRGFIGLLLDILPMLIEKLRDHSRDENLS